MHGLFSDFFDKTHTGCIKIIKKKILLGITMLIFFTAVFSFAVKAESKVWVSQEPGCEAYYEDHDSAVFYCLKNKEGSFSCSYNNYLVPYNIIGFETIAVRMKTSCSFYQQVWNNYVSRCGQSQCYNDEKYSDLTLELGHYGIPDKCIYLKKTSNCGSNQPCTAGWECNANNWSNDFKGYQYSNCDWKEGTVEYCEYGCSNGNCLTPGSGQSQPPPQQTKDNWIIEWYDQGIYHKEEILSPDLFPQHYGAWKELKRYFDDDFFYDGAPSTFINPAVNKQKLDDEMILIYGTFSPAIAEMHACPGCVYRELMYALLERDLITIVGTAPHIPQPQIIEHCYLLTWGEQGFGTGPHIPVSKEECVLKGSQGHVCECEQETVQPPPTSPPQPQEPKYIDDLYILSKDITVPSFVDFSYDPEGYGEPVMIKAIVRSKSAKDMTVRVKFYDGDPSFNKQISDKDFINKIIDYVKIPAHGSYEVEVEWFNRPKGEHTIFVVLEGTISDINPNNNKASKKVTVCKANEFARSDGCEMAKLTLAFSPVRLRNELDIIINTNIIWEILKKGDISYLTLLKYVLQILKLSEPPTMSEFSAVANEQANFFIENCPLKDCSDSVKILKLYDPCSTGTGTGMGVAKENILRDIETCVESATLNYDFAIGLAKDQKLEIEDLDFVFDLLPPGFTFLGDVSPTIFAEIPTTIATAHEMGHKFWLPDKESGSSIMSYWEAPGPRTFSSDELAILQQKDLLKCSVPPKQPQQVIGFQANIYQDELVELKKLSLVEATELLPTKEGDYAIKLLAADGSVIAEYSFDLSFEIVGADGEEETTDYAPVSFRIPYSEEAVKIVLTHNDNVIFEEELNFCNNNDVCDSTENHHSCSQDCVSGSGDGYCDGIHDAVCDPDCAVGIDLDCTPPSINIELPETKIYSYKDSVMVSYDVTDDEPIEVEIETKLDNAFVDNNIDMNLLELGTHKFSVKATDYRGSVNKEFVYFITIDDIPPKTTDNSDSTWHNEDIIVTLTSIDEKSDIMAIHYIINDEEEVIVENENIFTTEVLINYEDSNNKIEYWSVDEWNNTEEHNIVQGIKLDKTKPEIIINYPLDGTVIEDLKEFEINFEANDPVVQGEPSGIVSITAKLDDEPVENNQKLNPMDLLGGGHVLAVTVIDNAGNEETVLSTFTIASPSWTKKDAIEKLNTVNHKDVDKIIKHIKKSLNEELWRDEWRLSSKDLKECEEGDDKCKEGDKPKNGKKVFSEEKKAVKEIIKQLNKKGEKELPEETKQLYKELMTKLVKADEIIATIAIQDAKNTEVKNPDKQKKVDKELEKVEKEMNKAYEELSKNKQDKAIDKFKKAWEHANHAIKHAKKE